MKHQLHVGTVADLNRKLDAGWRMSASWEVLTPKEQILSTQPQTIMVLMRIYLPETDAEREACQ